MSAAPKRQQSADISSALGGSCKPVLLLLAASQGALVLPALELPALPAGVVYFPALAASQLRAREAIALNQPKLGRHEIQLGQRDRSVRSPAIVHRYHSHEMWLLDLVHCLVHTLRYSHRNVQLIGNLADCRMPQLPKMSKLSSDSHDDIRRLW
jgi:hypothetical protein